MVPILTVAFRWNGFRGNQNIVRPTDITGSSPSDQVVIYGDVHACAVGSDPGTLLQIRPCAG